MKKMVLWVFLASLLLISANALAADSITIKIASAQPEDFNSPAYTALFRFKDYIESASGGKISVLLQMGGEGDKPNLAAVKAGTCQMAETGLEPVPQYFRSIELLSLPYQFSSPTVAWRVLDGRFGQEMTQFIAKSQGMRILAFADVGFRCFTTNSGLLQEPLDFKGLRFQSREDPLDISLLKALGTQPLTIPPAEIYQALKNNAADGQEATPAQILQARLNEVQRYCTLDYHTYEPHFLWINEKFYQGLPREYKTLVYQASQIAQTVYRGEQQLGHARAIAALKAGGMNVYQLSTVEGEKFRKLVYGPVFNNQMKHLDEDWVSLFNEELAKAEKAELEAVKKR